MERHVQAWWIAGVFALVATLISFFQMRNHIKFNPNPKMRKLVIRILGMVPMYCLESWFGLRYKNSYIYFDTLRDCYEALVIYSFFEMLVEYLGGQEALIGTLSMRDTTQTHMVPFCCLDDWRMGEEFYRLNKFGVLQYVAVKPVLSGITFILHTTDSYCDGEFRADCGYLYVTFIANVSQIWALYCLVMFYLVTRDLLQDLRPVPKFLCIKLIVFATFWQAVLIAILVEVGLIQDTETYTADNIATGLQDFIICIEMLFAAIAHKFAFDYRDFIDSEKPHPPGAPMLASFVHAANMYDVVKDIHQNVLPDMPKSVKNVKLPRLPNPLKKSSRSDQNSLDEQMLLSPSASVGNDIELTEAKRHDYKENVDIDVNVGDSANGVVRILLPSDQGPDVALPQPPVVLDVQRNDLDGIRESTTSNSGDSVFSGDLTEPVEIQKL